jgi:hypothetical protein
MNESALDDHGGVGECPRADRSNRQVEREEPRRRGVFRQMRMPRIVLFDGTRAALQSNAHAPGTVWQRARGESAEAAQVSSLSFRSEISAPRRGSTKNEEWRECLYVHRLLRPCVLLQPTNTAAPPRECRPVTASSSASRVTCRALCCSTALVLPSKLVRFGPLVGTGQSLGDQWLVEVCEVLVVTKRCITGTSPKCDRRDCV